MPLDRVVNAYWLSLFKRNNGVLINYLKKHPDASAAIIVQKLDEVFLASRGWNPQKGQKWIDTQLRTYRETYEAIRLDLLWQIDEKKVALEIATKIRVQLQELRAATPQPEVK